MKKLIYLIGLTLLCGCALITGCKKSVLNPNKSTHYFTTEADAPNRIIYVNGGNINYDFVWQPRITVNGGDIVRLVCYKIDSVVGNHTYYGQTSATIYTDGGEKLSAVQSSCDCKIDYSYTVN